jgi:hypothetical protein
MSYKLRVKINISLLLLCAASAGRAQDLGRYATGTLVSIDKASMSLQPPPRFHGERPSKETYKFDPVNLKVLKMDIGVGGIHTTDAGIADVCVGERVSVKHTNEVATELRILPPPQVQGTIVAIGRDLITVRSPNPTAVVSVVDQSFILDDEHSLVTSTPVMGAPARKIASSDLRIGQGVSVLAKNGFAFVIRVLPMPPVIGTVSRINANAITLKVTSRLPATNGAEREFEFDPHKVEVFHQYFGEGVQPGVFAELAVGNEVGVVTQDGKAMAITINHPAVYGILSTVGSDFITVTIKDSMQQVDRKFKISNRTTIFVGTEDHSTKMPSGKTLHVWRFSGGGHISDLQAGEFVSITAKGDEAISIRERPTASQAR